MTESTRSGRRADRRTSSSPVPPTQRSVSIIAAASRAATHPTTSVGGDRIGIERRAADRRVTDLREERKARAWQDASGGPSTQLVSVVLAAALAAGLATGLGAGLRGPTVEPLALVGSTSLDPTAPPDAKASTGSTPSAASGPASTPATSRGPAPSPDKASFVTAPWSRNYDFAVVKGIRRGSDQVVTLTVDRLTFYTGAQATSYFKAHPALPQADYAIVNQNARLYTYPLVTGAPLYGATALAGTVAATPLTSSQLVTRTEQALAAGRPVYVWLHHDDHDLAWTTYLAEQYLP